MLNLGWTKLSKACFAYFQISIDKVRMYRIILNAYCQPFLLNLRVFTYKLGITILVDLLLYYVEIALISNTKFIFVYDYMYC